MGATARVRGSAGSWCQVRVEGRYAGYYAGAQDWQDGLRQAWREMERIRAFDATCEAREAGVGG